MLGKSEEMKSSLLEMEKGQACIDLKLDKLIRIHETSLPGRQLPPDVQLPLPTLAKVDALEEHIYIYIIIILCEVIIQVATSGGLGQE